MRVLYASASSCSNLSVLSGVGDDTRAPTLRTGIEWHPVPALPNAQGKGYKMPPMFAMRSRNHLRAIFGFKVVAAGVLLALTSSFGLRSLRASEPPSESASTKATRSLTYQNDRIESAPWSTHVAKIARNDPSLEVRSTLARGTVLGLDRLSDQALAIPSSTGTPLAGVNGDFYERDNSRYAGDPRGLQIVDGDLVSAPADAAGYCAFWIDVEGNPHTADVESKFKATLPDGSAFAFGLNEERRSGEVVLYTPTLGRATKTVGGREIVLERNGQNSWLPLRVGETFTAKVREIRDTGSTPLAKDILVLSFGPRLATNLAALVPGAVVTLSTATEPDLRGARTAIGGGSIITRGGKAAKIERPKPTPGLNSYTINSMFERHPRAAVGWSQTHIYLVEVDGRQRGLSVGMTLAELGAYMAKIGCEEAINLDGGGSATFWYRGRVVNSPCDGSERPVANGLVVIRKAAAKVRCTEPGFGCPWGVV